MSFLEESEVLPSVTDLPTLPLSLDGGDGWGTLLSADGITPAFPPWELSLSESEPSAPLLLSSGTSTVNTLAGGTSAVTIAVPSAFLLVANGFLTNMPSTYQPEKA